MDKRLTTGLVFLLAVGTTVAVYVPDVIDKQNCAALRTLVEEEKRGVEQYIVACSPSRAIQEQITNCFDRGDGTVLRYGRIYGPTDSGKRTASPRAGDKPISCVETAIGRRAFLEREITTEAAAKDHLFKIDGERPRRGK